MRLFVTAIVVAATSIAHATPAETEALVHLDKGVAAYRAGDFALAHEELEAAHRLAPDKPNPYRWLALTDVELGDCASALVNVESFLSRVPRGDPRVAEITKLRERCVLELRANKPAPVTPPPAPPPVTEETPMTHRWWFWPAVGAVALTAAGLTYVVVHDDGPPQLPPIICAPSGCKL